MSFEEAVARARTIHIRRNEARTERDRTYAAVIEIAGELARAGGVAVARHTASCLRGQIAQRDDDEPGYYQRYSSHTIQGRLTLSCGVMKASECSEEILKTVALGERCHAAWCTWWEAAELCTQLDDELEKQMRIALEA